MSTAWAITLALPGLVLPEPERLGRVVPPVFVGRLTIEELATRYLEVSREQKRHGDETQRTYRNALRAARELIVDGASVLERDVQEVTQGWAQKVHDAVQARSGGAMADKFAKLIAAAHGFMANRGVDLPPNPWSKIERYGSPPPDITFPEEWLLDALEVIEAAHREGKILHPRTGKESRLPRKVADFYTLCLCTGARPWCEILLMRWADIDASRGSIRFPESKGDKKRRKRVRFIPLELLCPRGREALERQRSSSEYVWPGRFGGSAGDTQFAEWWVPFRDWVLAGSRLMLVDDHGKPLDLYRAGRHGFASHLDDLGFEPHIIAGLLGQKDVRVQERYVHRSGRKLKAPARLVAASLERGEKRMADVQRPGVVVERLERAIEWLEKRCKANALFGRTPTELQIHKKDGSVYSEAAIASWKRGGREPDTSVVHQIAMQIGISVGWLFGEGPDALPDVMNDLEAAE